MSTYKRIDYALIDPDAIKNTMLREYQLSQKDKYYSDTFDALQSNIRIFGIITPITVRPLTDEEKKTAKKNTEYGIIDGHTRYAAFTNMAKHKLIPNEMVKDAKIPCVIITDEAAVINHNDSAVALAANFATLDMSEIDKGRHVHRLLDTAIADKDGKVIYKAGKNRGKPKKYSASTVAELLGISKSYVTKLNRIYLAYKQGVPDIPDDNAAEDYTAKYFNDGEINKQQLTTDLTAKLATITAKMDLATKDDYETITKEIDATRQILGLLKQQINNSTEVTSSKQYVILNARIDKTQAKIDDLKVKLEEATTPKAKLAISSRLTKAEAKLAILKGKAEGYKKVSFYK